MPCTNCITDWHEHCFNFDENNMCCCAAAEAEYGTADGDVIYEKLPLPASTGLKLTPTAPASVQLIKHNTRNRPDKPDTELVDIVSAGRKRAAKLAPIYDGQKCDWARLRNAGGGVLPIIGCDGKNPAENIHHGPDKSTLNNAPENLHRVCATCHNRWHTLNDPFYGVRPDGGLPFIPINQEMKPHDKETEATDEEIALSEKRWLKNRPKKAKAEDYEVHIQADGLLE